ncbi:MAG: response regulator transcription factor [Bacteroidales bacterium]|nr:response regulator transcription factor [Bacteroidales bacterium]
MINLIIVEDLPIVLEGIGFLLSQEKEFNILHTYTSGAALLRDFNQFQTKIDIIIADIEMPELNGIELTKKILKKNADIKIIALTMHNEPEYCQNAFLAGARGYVSKEKYFDDLRTAIYKVYEGDYYISNEYISQIIQGITKEVKPINNTTLISQREKELIYLIAEGFINKEIASHMNMSLRAIESLKSRLLNKTNTRNNASLLVWAIKNKVLNLDTVS